MKPQVSLYLAAIVLVGCADPNVPRDYDDCILKNMTGVDSDMAALQIMQACRKQFPQDTGAKIETRELELLEIIRLTGRASLSFGNTYTGNIYNGNDKITVTSVVIEITSKNGSEEVTRKYQESIKIPPLSTADFSFDIVVGDQGSEYSWAIVSALGYEN